MLQKFAMVKYGVFVAKICKHALCVSAVRDIWWSPLARQLLPPWFGVLGVLFGVPGVLVGVIGVCGIGVLICYIYILGWCI